MDLIEKHKPHTRVIYANSKGIEVYCETCLNDAKLKTPRQMSGRRFREPKYVLLPGEGLEQLLERADADLPQTV